MAREIVAYRFRDRLNDLDWCFAGADELPEEDRETLESKGWEVEPLTTMEDDDG